jgi:putative flavoprotein involved in K+ transport
MPAERLESLVIGAGQSGLGVSRELARQGIAHAVLEQGRIGESWRSQRWDSFRLNSPNWMNVLPGGRAPARPHGFASAREFAAGLERYAAANRLPVRRGVIVRAVEHDRRGEGFSVATDDGLYVTRSVVVASGGARVPRVPRIGVALPEPVLQIHAADYRNADMLPSGAVLVVGSAQSGVQIADDLLDAGRRVYLSSSAVGRVPRRYRGRDIFGWLIPDGFFDQPRRDDDGWRPPPNPQLSGGAREDTLSYQSLERRGAVLLGRLAAVSGFRVGLRDDLAQNAALADETSAKLRRRVDAYIARTGADAPPPEEDPSEVPYPADQLPSSPAELDLRAAGVTVVLWATGFSSDTSFLRLPVVSAGGEFVQRDGATAVPGLFVAGQPWMRTRGSGTIHGVAADAPHVAMLVSRHLWRRERIAA